MSNMRERAEITIFSKECGPLTKKIEMVEDGIFRADGSECRMGSGTARRLVVAGADQLAQLIGGLAENQAIALGRLRADLPDKVRITTKGNSSAENGSVTRTSKNIVFAKGAHAIALIDFDTKDMPEPIRQKVDKIGGGWAALCTVMPELGTVERVTRASTSAGIFRSDTGEKIGGSGGLHAYVFVQDGADIDRFLRGLHERLWLNGFGWHAVGAAGQLLDRSLIDRMVGAAERLIFEGGPLLTPPLEQKREARRPIAVSGEILNTEEVCPPLTVVELTRLRDIKTCSARELAAESARERQAFVERQAKRIADRTGGSLIEAKRTASLWCDGFLMPDVALPFDADEFSGCTVGDVLRDSFRFEDATLADPLEGTPYGRCKAKIMLRADGTPWINSFAHGRTVYELKYDKATVQKAILQSDKNQAVEIFSEYVKQSEINVVERKALIDLVAQRSGAGKREIEALYRLIESNSKKARQNEERDRRRAERKDGRPIIKAPAHDAEILPVCRILDEALTSPPDAPRPLCRDIDGFVTEATCIRVPRTRAFTSDAVKDSELPPPEQWGLRRMTEVDLAQAIERKVHFVEKDDRSVHLPTQFVRHYLRQSISPLPMLVAGATLPVVLADGTLVAPEGIDRERGIWFEIPHEVREVIPRPEDCDAASVKAAMTFLCDDWLCDVASDATGKCTLIAAALTLIERSLLDQRPCFFVIAGRRGGGKTTTLKMLIKAVTGLDPAAAAWSTNEDERRKALLSYFLGGVAYVLWDNIPRGAQIQCPHIEKSCTAAFYADRKLGVSEMVATAASCVHFFTGNNISPRGDLASRSLQVRLDIERPDPENRSFKYPDPIGFTDANRGKILNALYTVLLGNPMLKRPADAPCRTRFKLWWRLVGSAVEHAAGANGCELDFGRLFLDQESGDEEGIGLAEALSAMASEWPKEFISGEVANLINNEFEGHHSDALRDFLFGTTPPKFVATSRAVGKRLKAYQGCPVQCGDVVLTLTSREGRGGTAVYSVKVEYDGEDLFG